MFLSLALSRCSRESTRYESSVTQQLCHAALVATTSGRFLFFSALHLQQQKANAQAHQNHAKNQYPGRKNFAAHLSNSSLLVVRESL